MLGIITNFLQRIDLRSKVGEIFAEPLYSLKVLLLLLGNDLLTGEGLVFIEGLGEGSD